ncbi:MAG: hypothetical protein ABR508_04995 [Candidatus Baltobacteraceae bacterium]
MTITEHLQFNVLSAPLAQADRRALSQAWYSALYGERQGGVSVAHRSPVTAASGAGRRAPRAQSAAAPASASCEAPKRNAAAQSAVRGAAPDRRAGRSALARKIEQTLLRPHVRVKNATFVLAQGRARVHIVLRTQGARVLLIALCPQRERDCVSRALAQARFALAARGVALQTQLEEASP